MEMVIFLFMAIFVSQSLSQKEEYWEEKFRILEERQMQCENQQGMQIQLLEERIDELEKQQKSNSMLGFSARAAGGNQCNGCTVTFDGVITNFGSAYDGSTTFTCPVSGVYAFTVTILSDYAKEADVFIVHSDDETVRTHAHPSGNFNQATNFVVLDCNAEETVYVRAKRDFDLIGGSESVFSGFLLSITY